MPISFSQVALGTTITIPTLTGNVEIAAGVQSGKKMRLKGKGIQRLGSYGQGDQIVTIHVETPTKLTSEQRKMFEKLADLDSGARIQCLLVF